MYLFVYLAITVGAGYLATSRKTDYVPLERYVNEHVPRLLTQLPKMSFTEVTKEAGIEFVHDTGHYGEVLFPEVNGPGCGFFDFDNDGDQDIFLVNSGKWPHKITDDGPTVTHSLYVNDGHGHFRDLGGQLGLHARSYGHGVCFGDIDNDGFTDVYVTCVGRNVLYRNRGGKEFEDITAKSQAGGDSYSTAAAFLDYNKDGLIDLFVANYVEWSVEIERQAHKKNEKEMAEKGMGTLEYLAQGRGDAEKKRLQSLLETKKLDFADGTSNVPSLFKPAHCQLYQNIDGTRFEDVSTRSGIYNPEVPDKLRAYGMAVGVFDCNEDGWPDISVASDQKEDFLLLNQGDGTFKDQAGEYGTALSNSGQSRAGMGMAWAYFANDERLAMVVSNYIGQDVGFYLRPKKESLVFIDAASMVGVGGPTRDIVMWGLFFFDFDLDGLQDLFIAGGHVARGRAKYSDQEYEQSSVLLWNSGDHPEFIQVNSTNVGNDLFVKMVARGAAYADIDGDGDLDILVASNGGAARLFRNDLPTSKYVRMTLVGSSSNRSALGARVTLFAGQRKQIREVSSGGSYCSQSELTVTFGLGAMPPPERAVIQWPSGTVQEIKPIDVNRSYTIIESGSVTEDEK